MQTKSANPVKMERLLEFLRSKRFSFWVLGAVVLFYSVILISRTVLRGDDFLVFYRVAQRFWDGVRPYDPVTFGNMVFKYPPWILPFFLPFSLLDLGTAKFLWGLIEAYSLFVIVRKVHSGFSGFPAVRPWLQVLLLLVLFGLIGSHGLTGQVTLPILAIALSIDPLRASFFRFLILATVFSVKVTTLFPMIHVLKRKRLVTNIAGIVLIFFVLSLPIYLKSYSHHYGAMRDEWISAMFSGTQDVNSVRIGFTTREVQGLPSFLLRHAGLDEQKPRHVLFATAISFILLGTGWAWLSRKKSAAVKWVGWLALLPAVQPLAWFHVFLFGYPALAVAGELALRARRFAGVFVGALLIGAVSAKTMGEFGNQLELLSVKLWGLLSAVGFFLVLNPSVDERREVV